MDKDKIKILTIIGTRPEIIRLSRIIPKLDEFFDHNLVHTGQNYDYELNEIFFSDLELRRPDYYLDCARNSSAETIAQIIEKVDRLLAQIEPDAVLILGDTNSALSAIPAKRRKIPIFHMEAGNRCFDMRVPEEINRRIVDHISDINIPYSKIARDYLLREGLNPSTIVVSGSPMNEVLDYYDEKISKSNVLKKFEISRGKYFVASLHREENVDLQSKLENIVCTLNEICETQKMPIILSLHPRTRKQLDKLSLSLHSDIRISKPLCFTDYIKLQANSRLVLSDSGTITEEASIMNFPAINLRDTHERPEGMEQAAVILCPVNTKYINSAIEILDTQGRDENRSINIVDDYYDKNISEKIIRIIISHIDFINQLVWKK